MKEGRSSERQSHNKRGKEESEAAGNASKGQGKGKPKYCTYCRLADIARLLINSYKVTSENYSKKCKDTAKRV